MQHLGRHRLADERPARTWPEPIRVVPVSREDRHRLAVIVVTRDSGVPETKNLGDLLSDRLEHLARRRAAGHERRNTAQGRLLLSEAA